MSRTRISIHDLMGLSGVKFGTSGARGLASAMTDRVCYAYTRGFLQHLEAIGDLDGDGSSVAIGGDLRPSTPRILRAVTRAILDQGYQPISCGLLPSPALANFSFANTIPSVMVTGSHIPADRNGIKYNRPSGEVLKDDEAGMMAQVVEIDENLFDAAGGLQPESQGPELPLNDGAEALYQQRFLDFFGDSFLRGRRIGLYQHSAVGRDLLLHILQMLGAEVTCLGYSTTFVPVDTEAIRPEDAALAREWAASHQFDAIFSTDGDSDRPLVSDEAGNWLRGDIAGILTSLYLDVDSVSLPVSCNTALELTGKFRDLRRTRIGSPYVIAAMNQAVTEGFERVAGYEANGGYLTATDIGRGGRVLTALPSRDPLTVLLCILGLAIERKVPISALVSDLPSRHTYSGLLRDFPTERSAARLASLDPGGMQAQFGALCGGGQPSLDRTDGLRATFGNGEIIHLRPSGNAPEFRSYVEAGSAARAATLLDACLAIMTGWKE